MLWEKVVGKSKCTTQRGGKKLWENDGHKNRKRERNAILPTLKFCGKKGSNLKNFVPS